jgi:hypothetical protein
MQQDESIRTCVECGASMFLIVIMDKLHPWPTKHRYTGSLEYRLPDDSLSFWTGKYPTAGPIDALMCENCGRIALYGGTANASQQEPGE